MRKIKLFQIVLVLSAACTLVAGCAAEEQKQEETHTHAWTFAETLEEADCTEGGSERWTCACGESEVRETSPLGHAFGEWEHTEEPTCEEDGLAERACGRCGERETEPLAATGHDWQEVSVLVEPTCTTKGKRAAKCRKCGAEEQEQEIDPLPHPYGDWKRFSDPTCDMVGTDERFCTVCGNRETRTVEALGHNWQPPTVDIAPTCSSEGKSFSHCSRCSAVREEGTVPKTEHSWGAPEETPATCENAGKIRKSCMVCGEVEERSLPPLGHAVDRNQWVIDEEPTAERGGTKSHHCTRTGCMYREDVTDIPPISDNTAYSVHVLLHTGAELPSGYVSLSIFNESGSVRKEYGMREITEVLPSDTYTVRASFNFRGYTFEYGKDVSSVTVTLTPGRPEAVLYAYGNLIMEAPPKGLTYMEKNVLYDESIKIVGRVAGEDYETTISALLSQYKGILINHYFPSCSACVGELPSFIEAYNATSSTGRPYREEIAIVMLIQKGYSLNDVRTFKNGQQGGLPFLMAYAPDFQQRFAVGAFPTTVMINCEGMYLGHITGGMSAQGFKNFMETYGIGHYEKVNGKTEVSSVAALPARRKEDGV